MLNDAAGFKRIFIAAGYTDLRRGIDGLQESYSISLNLIHTIKIQSFYSAEERMTG